LHKVKTQHNALLRKFTQFLKVKSDNNKKSAFLRKEVTVPDPEHEDANGI
jgi:hypothetical protein